MKYKGYLIDLDGTVYRGNEVIPEAAAFVARLNEQNIPHLFLTNNSSRTPEEAADKLIGMGIQAAPENIYTSSLAMADYVRYYYGGGHPSAYVIGSNGLYQALADIQVKLRKENPDLVIVGIDLAITYDKLTCAAAALQNGADFLATNGDLTIPTHEGLKVGNGSIVKAIAAAGGKEATFVGKPKTWIVERALQILGTDRSETLMIGDNYDTDILAGIHAGVDTLHVGSGVTPAHLLVEKEVQPTYTEKVLHPSLLTT